MDAALAAVCARRRHGAGRCGARGVAGQLMDDERRVEQDPGIEFAGGRERNSHRTLAPPFRVEVGQAAIAFAEGVALAHADGPELELARAPAQLAAAPDLPRRELTNRGARRIRCLDHAPEEAAATEVPAPPVVCLGAPGAGDPASQAHVADPGEPIEPAVLRNPCE